MKITHISFGGPERIIEIGGKDYHFEMHPHLGPMPIHEKSKNERKLSHNHFFWHAVSIWAQQGEKLLPDGKCDWHCDVSEYKAEQRLIKKLTKPNQWKPAMK